MMQTLQKPYKDSKLRVGCPAIYLAHELGHCLSFSDYQFTENRIESSSMPRWETNGVFFCLNQAE